MRTTFREVWVVDFEFTAPAGERPTPLCMVAHEVLSGRQLRLWADALAEGPPFDLGHDVLYVAYYAPAEMQCHLALGWPLPACVLDLYAEFRVKTNGKTLTNGRGLLGAMAYFGLDAMAANEKADMRELAMRGGPYTEGERQALLEYCATDVVSTERLLSAMLPDAADTLPLARSLLRGRYSKAVAHMQHHGIPIDTATLGRLRMHWSALRGALITDVDQDFDVYDGSTFKIARFEAYLQRQGWTWPTTPTGRLKLNDDTFKEQTKAYPALLPLRDLRRTLGQLRLDGLAVGADGRNRCMLSMFQSITGRNQPSTTQFIFGLSAWLRALIQPAPGWGLAYIDWSQQEFGIAAALSGDARMQEAYESGDPYLSFAKQAGAVPAQATKHSHAAQREQFKACVLAVQYGMGAEGLALRIGQPVPYAQELLRLHRRTYARFWAWNDGVRDYALTQGKLWTAFGWPLYVGGSPNVRSLCNFPMQANGAEMLRLACCLGTEAGIRVIAPVHDAVLIEAPLDELDHVAGQMQGLMREASLAVLGDTFALQSDVTYIRAPGRYLTERGEAMWQRVGNLLERLEADAPTVSLLTMEAV